MPKNISTTLADAIEREHRTGTAGPLPSIRQLSERYRVSYRTMWKAVQILIRKGLVATAPGITMAFVGARENGVVVSGPQPSHINIYNMIKQRVLDGAYKAGDRLPKIGYFAASENVKSSTVSRAMARLAADSLAHKHKGRWIAGPPAPKNKPGTHKEPGSERPVVMHVMTTAAEAHTFAFEAAFSAAFMLPLRNELLTYGIHFMPAMIQAPKSLDEIPCGLDEIKATIRSLGSRYQGMLLNIINPIERGLDTSITEMAGFSRRPIVYFDITDQGEWLTRKNLSLRSGYYRLHLDERRAVEIALAALVARGHTRIGVHGADIYDWSMRRLDRIKMVARAMASPPTIVCSGQSEDIWRSLSSLGMHEIMDHALRASRLSSNESADDSTDFSYSQSLMKSVPSLTTLLIEQRPSALIALNDRLAREYYYALKVAGILVPAHLSMVSFDNSAESVYIPLSTIDFGLPRLGYLAAHIFINDMPVHGDHEGNIAGLCTLVDQGSIGPASRKGAKRITAPARTRPIVPRCG